MSIAMIQAFKAAPLKPTEKLVAFMLADHLNDKTGRCHPSVRLLAEETGLTVRSVITALQKLNDSGYITKQETDRTGQNRHYILHPEKGIKAVKEVHRCKRFTGEGVSPGVVKEFHRGGEGVSPEAVKEIHLNPNKPQENHNLNQKDCGGSEIRLPADAHRDLQEAWTEWQAYRQYRTTAKGKQKLAWTEQAARMGAKQVMEYSKSHGVRIVCDRIASAIGGGWQGMNLDKLEVQKQLANHGQYNPFK